MPDPPLVLAYHAVHPPEPGISADDVIIAPERIEQHVRALQADGYRFMTAGELAAGVGAAAGDGPQADARVAVLTFDDGWRDGLTVAAPLLSRLGVRGTFFVCPGLWGNHDARMGEAGWILTEDEARELHGAGMELGAHSVTHPDLRALDDAQLRDELVGSKAAVEAITGVPCSTLAYPFGVYDRRVKDAARAAGFELAFTFAPGRWEAMAAPRLPAELVTA